MRAIAESSPLPQTMQVASVPLGLVSTQAQLISVADVKQNCSFFFRKSRHLIVISVEFVCIQDYKVRREEAYARDKLNI